MRKVTDDPERMPDDWPERVRAARTPEERLHFLETTLREAFRTARNAQGTTGEMMAAITIWHGDDKEAAEATQNQQPQLRGEQTVREWLDDYFVLIEDTEMVEILADVAERRVSSFGEARAQVNLKIDLWISWLNRTRPARSPVEE